MHSPFDMHVYHIYIDLNRRICGSILHCRFQLPWEILVILLTHEFKALAVNPCVARDIY